MASLAEGELSGVFPPPLNMKVLEGGPAFSIPFIAWEANYPDGYDWWFEVFKRAEKKNLFIKKVRFEMVDGDKPRTGFQFFRTNENEATPAGDWVSWAESKRIPRP